MRVDRLELSSFPVPFKTVFRHASARRAQAENLIVAAHSACGHVGYGEGCPRSYVTGETVETASAFVRSIAGAMTEAVHDVTSLRAWIETHGDTIDRNPAAFCAVEIAVLDLLGKIENYPVERLVGAPPLEGSFQYSAILGDAPYPIYWWQFRRYWARGFRDFKIKVSGDPRRDRRKLNLIGKRTNHDVRLRLDANNLWTNAEACVSHITDLPGDVFAIEEPLQSGDLDGFRRVAEACQAKIILDESLLRAEQLDALDDPDRWIANIRVSKMGGVLRSLELAEKAARKGIGIIVGAQVGETSILTRAALTVMNASQPNLVAAEGAFGTLLLKRDLTMPCLMFGEGGKLNTEHTSIRHTPGLGLRIHDADLVALP